MEEFIDNMKGICLPIIGVSTFLGITFGYIMFIESLGFSIEFSFSSFFYIIYLLLFFTSMPEWEKDEKYISIRKFTKFFFFSCILWGAVLYPYWVNLIGFDNWASGLGYVIIAILPRMVFGITLMYINGESFRDYFKSGNYGSIHDNCDDCSSGGCA